ncbi:unnamed protein product [Enterobius vermicularis]|uniref:Uncharacterized protein n=1 Tax=Enterobius vermicularis TaxID=51028 RepID=A0A0N4V048_ENTVE|nr:unnamed protein product [Enterobius vermicularis]
MLHLQIDSVKKLVILIFCLQNTITVIRKHLMGKVVSLHTQDILPMELYILMDLNFGL